MGDRQNLQNVVLLDLNCTIRGQTRTDILEGDLLNDVLNHLQYLFFNTSHIGPKYS